MSDPKTEPSLSEDAASENVERQIRDVSDPLTQHLAQLCALLKELGDAHTHGRHKETTSSKTTGSSTSSRSRSDIVRGTLNPAFAPLSTLVPPARLTSIELPPHQRAFGLDDQDEEPAANTRSQMNQVVVAINSLPAILQRDLTQNKMLHKQVPIFRGSKDKLNEFEHLLSTT